MGEGHLCTTPTAFSCFSSVTTMVGVVIIGSMYCGFDGLWVCWTVGLLYCGFAGLWVCWTVGLLDCGFVGLWACWTVGLLDCGFVGLWVCWTVGLLDCGFCWTPSTMSCYCVAQGNRLQQV